MAIQKNSSDTDLMSEINMTPFVDVVLVLLVIFIVTAPALVKHSQKLNLPKLTEPSSSMKTSVGVSVSRSGQILLEGISYEKDNFIEEIKRRLQTAPDLQALIAIDRQAEADFLIEAIDWLKLAGLENFALQVDRKNPTTDPTQASQ